MSLAFSAGSIVASPGQQFGLSGLLSNTGGNNPAYVVLSGLDRDEYTAASNGRSGSVSGNGQTATFSTTDGDATSFGILFKYDAASGQYVSSQYGSLSSLVMTASTDKGRVAALSLFGSNDASVLSQYKDNAIQLLINASSSYLGTLDVVVQPGITPPAYATPNSIASIAQTFVGQAWNSNGCWLLACTISAEAGASLPVASTLAEFPGQANGEWVVAYNGPSGSSGDWKSMVRTGDVIVFKTAGGTGHIATVTSGAGATAKVIDNTTFVNAAGTVVNAANDGSANDIIIAKAHLFSAESNGVDGASVVIYRLDTPVVTATSTTVYMTTSQARAMTGIVTVSDPANRPITSYQLYDTTAGDSFSVGGTTLTATSAAGALTLSASAFAATSLKAGSTLTKAVTGTLMARAFNGSYWGDWTAVTIAATPSTISTTVADMKTNLASLNAALQAGTLSTIKLTDSPKPVLSLTASQLSTYSALVAHIAGSYVLSVTTDSNNAVVVGSKGTNQFAAGLKGGDHSFYAGASIDGGDTLVGGGGADTLYGSTSTGGMAYLVAGRGLNVLNGGLGADKLYGGGLSKLNAGAAYQTLLGGYTAASADTLNGAAGGHDFLAVASGNNVLNAGAGAGTVLQGGSGNDRLNGSTSADGSAIMIGGSGASSIMGGVGSDTLVGGGQSLLIAGGGKPNLLLGGYSANAHDTLAASANDALMAVANGHNILWAGSGHATLLGGAGNDYLAGGGGYGVLIGGTGLTTLHGGDGSDTLVGGGRSLLVGGSGHAGTSLLLGGFSAAAHDTLMAGTGGGQTLAVAMGNNVLHAGPGAPDLLIAGVGADTLYGADDGTAATYVVGSGHTTVNGGVGNDDVKVADGIGQIWIDGGAGANAVTFITQSEADASIATAASGVTTISFAHSAQTVTMAHVQNVVFASSGGVHHLAS